MNLRSHRIKKNLKSLLSSAWIFPIFLLALLCFLTLFKISGSSIGIYNQLFYTGNNHNLIYGQPKPVRVDEWLGGTQSTIAQERNGFSKTVTSAKGNVNLSLSNSIPNNDWSTLFKSHFWSYFIMPVENALAFSWWFMLFSCITAIYLFTLKITRNKFTSIVLGIAFSISPFALWWYQASIFMSFTYAFLSMILILRILNSERVFGFSNRNSKIIHTLVLAYLGCSLVFNFYPPFQIPIILTIVAFLIGCVLEQLKTYKVAIKKLLIKALPIILAGIITIAVTLLFYLTHLVIFNQLGHSVYPGDRRVHSGGTNTLNIFDSFLMPPLQGSFRGEHFFTNQSEASNFILLMPFLIIPCFFLSYRLYKKRKLDWIFLSINVLGLLFLLRIFVNFGDPLYKFLLLDRVPNTRLVIGLGLVGFLQIIYLLKYVGRFKINKSIFYVILIYSSVCFLCLLHIGNSVLTKYPLFIHREYEIILLSVFFTSLIFFILIGYRKLFLTLFLLFSISSSYKILPLYKGLTPVVNDPTVAFIHDNTPPNKIWAVGGSVAIENFPLMAGRERITGYPSKKFWDENIGKKYENIYNRQAHILLSETSSNDPIKLIQPNLFYIKMECSTFFVKNFDYVLTNNQYNYPCLKQIKTESYPKTTLYIYEIVGK